MKKTLFLLLLIIISPMLLNSTCIIIFKINHVMYVVSDTRSMRRNINGRDTSFNATIKKVHNVGDYWFAISGHADENLLKYAKKSINTDLPLIESVKLFRDYMKEQYTILMNYEKDAKSKGYEYFLKNNLAGVSFFTNTKKEEKLYSVYLWMNEIKGRPIIKDTIVERQETEFLGIKEHLDKMSDQELQTIKIAANGDFIKYATSLLDYERKFHDKEIGCPYDRMILTQQQKGLITRNKCN